MFVVEVFYSGQLFSGWTCSWILYRCLWISYCNLLSDHLEFLEWLKVNWSFQLKSFLCNSLSWRFQKEHQLKVNWNQLKSWLEVMIQHYSDIFKPWPLKTYQPKENPLRCLVEVPLTLIRIQHQDTLVNYIIRTYKNMLFCHSVPPTDASDAVCTKWTAEIAMLVDFQPLRDFCMGRMGGMECV